MKSKEYKIIVVPVNSLLINATEAVNDGIQASQLVNSFETRFRDVFSMKPEQLN